MAKQVIILDTNPSDGGLLTVRAVFWLPVAKGQEIPIPQLAASQWRQASDDEIRALQDGTVVEESRSFVFGQSLDTNTIHKLLEIAYQDRQSYLAALPQKGKYYGAFLEDGNWLGKG